MTAPTLLYNTRVETLDAKDTTEDAVLVSGGLIEAVGPRDELRDRASEEVDLNGGVLYPGFQDAHVHIWKVGHMRTTMLDARGTRSLDELGNEISDFCAALGEGAWFQGRGYNEALLEEKRHPTRHDLDEFCPDRPAFLIRTCAHIAVANTAALKLAGIDRSTVAPPGGVVETDEKGDPTGVLHESALGLVQRVIPKPTTEDYERMILAGCEELMKFGVTSATDPAVHPELIEAYRSLALADRLPINVDCLAIRRPDGGTETLPLPDTTPVGKFRCLGIKLFADGGLSGATAALSRPYVHADTKGVLRLNRTEINELASEAVGKGMAVGIHAIGDAAIEEVVSAYEALRTINSGALLRIEHLGLPTAELLDRASALGVIAVPQAIFIRELGGNFRQYIDEDYLQRAYPIRSMLEHGLEVALSSDGPVVRDVSPLSGIEAATGRLDHSGNVIGPTEKIDLQAALKMYTQGGRIASGLLRETGMIQPGSPAIFTHLSQPPEQNESGVSCEGITARPLSFD